MADPAAPSPVGPPTVVDLPDFAAPVGLYSHAVLAPAGSQLMAISGQLAITPDGEPIEGGFAAQFHKVVEQLDTVLPGVEADDHTDAGGASGGLHRGAAIGAAGVWAGLSELPAGHQSTPHHHGEQATIVYLISGAMEFTLYGDDGHVFTAHQGDFAVIPAGAVHSERNPSPDSCLCVVVRTEGEVPTVTNLSL